MKIVIDRFDKWAGQYALILFVGLFVVFLGAIVDVSGALATILFAAFLVLLLVTTGQLEDLLFFSMAVLINNQLTTGGLSVLSIRRIILVVIIIWLIEQFFIRGQKRTIRPVVSNLFFALWIIYMVLVTVYHGDSDMSSVISLILTMMMGVALQNQVCLSNNRTIEKFIIMLFVAFSFIMVIGYIELILNHTFFYSRWTTVERYRYGILRMGSTVGDPNNVGYMLVPFLFMLNCKSFKEIVPGTIRKAVIILSFVLCILTSSRATVVSLIVSFLFCIIAKRKAVFLITLPFLGIASNYALSYFNSYMQLFSDSTNYRNYIVENAILAWSKNIWVGIGEFESILGIDNAMNTYIYMLLVSGLIGLAFYIVYQIMFAKRDILNWIKYGTVDTVTLSRLSIIISSSIIAYSLDVFYLGLLWILPAFFTTESILDNCAANSGES